MHEGLGDILPPELPEPAEGVGPEEKGGFGRHLHGSWGGVAGEGAGDRGLVGGG